MSDSAPERMLRIGVAAAWLAVLALGLVIGWRTLTSWDVWWHLRIGAEAVTQRSTVPVDTLSFSFAGAPYRHKDLVGDIVMYLGFDTLGFAGLALLRALAVALAALGLWFSVPDARHRLPAWWFALALFALAAQPRIIPRPLLFSVALFPVMLGLIERAWRTAAAGPKALARSLLPCLLVQWVWLNLHRGGMLGIVLLTGFACALALSAVLHRVPALRPLAGPPVPWIAPAVAAGFAVGAVLVGLLNPNGAGLYTSGLSVSHDAIHRTQITEWQPLTWDIAITFQRGALAALSLGWAAVLGRLGLALARREHAPPIHAWHLGVLALFTWQGIASMRWLPYASAAAALGVALVLARALARARWRLPRGATALVATAAIATAHVASGDTFGLGEARYRYPADALAFAHEHELGPNVHNAFVYGGYVTWAGFPEFLTLVDGRNDMVYPSEFFRRCSLAQRDPAEFAALRAEVGSDWVLADNTPGRQTFLFLRDDPAWAMVYWSEAAVVYVPRDGADAELVARAYRFVHPADPVSSVGAAAMAAQGNPSHMEQVHAELLRLVSDEPDGIRANTVLALFYDFAGEPFAERRDEVVQQLLTIAPDHPAVVELVQRLSAP